MTVQDMYLVVSYLHDKDPTSEYILLVNDFPIPELNIDMAAVPFDYYRNKSKAIIIKPSDFAVTRRVITQPNNYIANSDYVCYFYNPPFKIVREDSCVSFDEADLNWWIKTRISLERRARHAMQKALEQEAEKALLARNASKTAEPEIIERISSNSSASTLKSLNENIFIQRTYRK